MRDPSLPPLPAPPPQSPPVPNATSRHLGDTLWPWFLGAVVLGGVAFIVYRLTAKKTDSTEPPDPSVVGDDDDDGEDYEPKRLPQSLPARWEEGPGMKGARGVGKFRNALPVRLAPPPSGFKRGTRARRLRGGYTREAESRYNLEVED